MTRSGDSLSKESEYIWFDGKLVRESEVHISVRSSSLHYGTAVFEGIRAYYNNDDLRIFRLKDHMQRLLESARMVHLETPFTLDVLADGVADLLRMNKFRSSVYIRPIVFAGEGGINLDFRNHLKHAAVFALPFSAYFERSGLRVCISSWRKISGNSVIPRAKAAANYLNS
jgi:branched-chain amino acid aminotransferase